MNDLKRHYRLLLGLSDEWNVIGIDLDLKANRVIIEPGGAVVTIRVPNGIRSDCSAHEVRRSSFDWMPPVGIDH